MKVLSTQKKRDGPTGQAEPSRNARQSSLFVFIILKMDEKSIRGIHEQL